MSVRNFSLQADEPLEVGGDNTGPTPTELLLASLASCFTMALAFAARKHGFRLPPDLEVRARGTRDGLRFSRFDVEVVTADPPEGLKELVDRAVGYCYVSNTLRRAPELSYRIAGPDD